MRFLFILGIAFLFNFTAQAQVRQAVISHNPQIAIAAKKLVDKPAVNRSQKGAALPFFDDFAYNGPFPDKALWMENLVFINNTLANAPISIGVATFDGLDGTGSPYGGGFGSSDTLTSIPLDLSGNNPKYLSYYIQPKGLGDPPGIIDRLVLEFKTASGEWEEVKSHEVTLEEAFFPVDSFPVFEFIQPIKIDSTKFLHEDFQFRFRNFSLRSGGSDLWHIDYVRLEDAEMTQSNADLAFTKLPSSILRDYSSVPWKHLQSELDNGNNTLILRDIGIEMTNLSNNGTGIASSQFSVKGIDNEEIPFVTQLLLNPNNNQQINPSNGRHSFTNPIIGEYEALYKNGFRTSESIQVQVDYSFAQNNAESAPTQRNNAVSRTFDLDNYYAYDDNSAESAYFIGTGGQIAVKFTNYKADLLQAIRIQIPRIVGGNITESNITLKVWVGDLNSEPVYEAPFTKPLFVDELIDTLQAFTTYVLKDNFTDELTPVDLPVGDFFIGWQQVTPCGNVRCFPVGFDRNTPAATETIFINDAGNWLNIPDFFDSAEAPPSQMGALMIRPVVGSEPPNGSETVSTTSLDLPQLLNIFPNPTTGEVNIQLFEGNYQDYQINIFNTLGQQVKSQTLSNELQLNEQTPGIYFLQFINTKTLATGNYKLVLKR